MAKIYFLKKISVIWRGWSLTPNIFFCLSLFLPESLFSSLLFREVNGFSYQTMQVPSCWHFWNARTAVSMQGNSYEIWWFHVLGAHPCLCAVQKFTVCNVFIPTQPFCPHKRWLSALSTLQGERKRQSGVTGELPMDQAASAHKALAAGISSLSSEVFVVT